MGKKLQDRLFFVEFFVKKNDERSGAVITVYRGRTFRGIVMAPNKKVAEARVIEAFVKELDIDVSAGLTKLLVKRCYEAADFVLTSTP